METPQPQTLAPDTRHPAPILFDLGLEESFVTLNISGLKLTHIFRPATHPDLAAHQDAVVLRTKTRDGKTIESEFDTTEADYALWQSLILRVGDYVHSRLGDIAKLDKWKEMVPPAHQLAAVQALYRIGLSPLRPDGSVKGGDQEGVGLGGFFDTALTIALEAIQNRKAIRVEHHFRDATTSELKEWRRIHAAPREVNKRGFIVSDYGVKLGDLTKLYDALIESVGGYAFKGTPIQTAEDARAIMDPIHKKAAITEAFRRLTDVGDEEGESPLA